MYEMMTAKTPFDGDTPVSVAIQHINGTAQQPRELNPDVPIGLEQITMHAMTADLNARYASASDMLNDLEEFRKNPAIQFHFTAPATVSKTAASGGTSHSGQQQGKPSQAQRNESRKPRQHNVAEVYGMEESKKPEEKKSSTGTVVAVVFLSLIAVVGLGYLLFGVLLNGVFGKASTVTVPNFVGESFEDIYPSEYPDFKFERKEWVNDDEMPYGYIVDQSPKGGTEAAPAPPSISPSAWAPRTTPCRR